MITARLTITAGNVLAVVGAFEHPPLTMLWLPGMCLIILGWARLQTLRMRARLEQGRRERLMGREFEIADNHRDRAA